MGVGDDSLLEDSISVTIIATGFNIDQQDEISNTEAKKVIHTLEDDNNLFSQKSELKETKEIILENSNNEKIVHVLEQDEPIANEDILVTNDNIKSIEVNAFELVTNEVIDTEDETNLIQNDMEDTVEEDFSPTFDWSLFDDTSSEVQNNEIENEAQIQGESLIDINEIEVVDFIELVSTEESNSDGETIHELNDHIVIEPLLKENSEDLEIDVLVEEESQMELINRDSIFKEESTNMVNEERVIDPLNSPIADLQLQRSKERRLKMKEFNYKFNNSKIDEIEKEPAYKRLGIDLDEVNHSSENNESRLTLNLDENEDIQLRTNNSFLHDNVD